MSAASEVMNFSDVKPKKPWVAPTSDRLKTLGVFLLSLAISYGVVAATPLKGKLAYVFIFFLAYTVIDYSMSFAKSGSAAATDSLFRGFVTAMVCLAIIPIVSILTTVWVRGYHGLRWNLFTTDMHSNTFLDPLGRGGLIHAIIGTFLLVLIAVVISVPLAILTAVYITEIKGSFTRPIQFLVQAMSGVPSIVAGLFILAAIIYPISKELNGVEGSLALAILMIPTVARTAQEVLLLIPQDLREAGVALGGTQWRTVAMIVIPAARSGLVTAMILGVARVAGETAPILLLTGGGNTTNWNIFHGPMGSLPNYIWQGFGSGSPAGISRAWSGILVLLGIVLVLFGLARSLGSKKVGK